MADIHDLARAQFGEAKPTQRFHVNEDISSAISACKEAKAAHPVEPLDHGSFPLALSPDLHMRALGQLRGMNSRALIHAQNAESLQAPGATEDFAVNAGPLVSNLVAAGTKTGHVKEDIRETIVGYDKAVTL